MRLDAYIRVSDVRGRSGETFISPAEQRDRIEAWAKSQGHEIIAVHEELDVSGGTVDRPLLNEVMRRIEAGETEGVVVAKLDRFGRTLVKSLELINRIRDRGALFSSVADNFDITTPTGRLVLNMMLSIAQWELERIGDQWASARTRAIRRGHYVGGRVPYGFRKHSDDGRLEPDPVEARVVKEVFEQRAAGRSWSQVRDWLHENGYRPPRAATWSPARFLQIVGNRVYLGELHDGVTGETLEDAHPALVSASTFEAAQRRRGGRTGNRRGLGSDAGLVLRGLARCAGCRYALISRPLQYYRQQNGRRSVAAGYGCGRHASHKDCPDHVGGVLARRGPRNLPGLEDYVLDQVRARYEVEARSVPPESEIADLVAQVKEAKLKAAAYAADDEAEQAHGREAYLVGAKVRREAVEQAEQALREEQRRIGANAGGVVRRLFQDDFDDLPIDERREAVASVVQAVFVRRSPNGKPLGMSAERVRIVWVEDPEIDVPRQGRRDYVLHPFVFDDADDPAEIGEALLEPTQVPAREATG